MSGQLTEGQLDLRQQTLSILFKEFGNGSPTNNMRIYECADKLMNALNCD